MRVAVLGSGPAGLMAAHAVVNAFTMNQIGDFELDIYSLGEKSRLFGAQYLHQPIPYITVPTYRSVDYRLVGTPDDYRRKVYGQLWDGSVSPEDFTGLQRAWDIRHTYDQLWAMYSGQIIPTMIEPVGMRNLSHDLIINSVPLDRLCHEGHHFGCTEIIAAGDAPELGINIGAMFRCMDDTVVCNGEPSPSWYRLSRIFGHTTVEWPKHGPTMDVPVKTASVVRKPISTNCDCWPNVIKVGRYGSWKKGVLSHDAYFDTWQAVNDLVKGESE